MKGARKELGGFQTAIRSAQRAILGFGSTLAAGFTIGAFRQAISEMDDMADAAERLGTSVKGLTGLTHAGFMSDVSSGSLVRALTIMEKNVANNAAGLKKLGINIYELRSLDAVEMFVQIAEAINSMPTAAERTAAAMAVFGRSGAELMELIGKGRGGIEQAMAQSPFPDWEVEKIEAADKAIKDLTQAYKALKMELALELAPLLPKITQGLNSATGQHGLNQLKQLHDLWVKIDSVMQKSVDDLAVRLGFQDRFDTREFREFAEGHKQRKHEEFSRWRKNTAETQRILDEARAWRPGGTGKWGFRDKRGWPLDFSKFKEAPSSTPFTAGSLMFNDMLLSAMRRMLPAVSDGLSLGAISRVQAQIEGMDIAGNAPMFRKRDIDTTVRVGEALEKGTAAAFSQERRSAQENRLLDVNQKQLQKQTNMDKALQSIDKNLKNAAFATEAANLA